ncbi:LLM class oxidoreductase [Marinicella sp. W31]|uniref:LLM class oxidoreductase n=1 Tax=Marinicella sp. W31 TaxID=3023713 RepID=UPI003756BE3C
MIKTSKNMGFEKLNNGYNSVFQLGKLSIGVVAPIERYPGNAIPEMHNHESRVQLAEKLGFAAVWLRDVPFNVPSFGDAGQLYDPFTYLGYLSAITDKIALGVASIILPLRHPAHLAKAAASVDVLSNGRLILGVASGDRPQEYPAMHINYADRGKRFRESFEYLREMQKHNPVFSNAYGSFSGDIDMLPKPLSAEIPMLITGGSQQNPEWIANHGNGWMTYPHEPKVQKKIIEEFQSRVMAANRSPQPVMQPLYIDLSGSKATGPKPIHLGFRSGSDYLIEHLKSLEQNGVNHVALNLRFNQRDIDTTLKQLAEEVLPKFM